MKPILFNTEMVRAILEGRKTVTRRVIKPHNHFRSDNYKQGYGLWIDATTDNGDKCGHIKDYSVSPCWQTFSYYIKNCAPYQVGDILYIRETWREYNGKYFFKANEPKEYDDYKTNPKWKPSIHMPKEAARIFLKVTDVRVERLQDITEEDAIKEGCEGTPCEHHGYIVGGGMCGCTDCMNTGWLEPPTLEFMDIWHSTIKKQDLDEYGWNANPWVWVIEFERFEKGGAE